MLKYITEVDNMFSVLLCFDQDESKKLGFKRETNISFLKSDDLKVTIFSYWALGKDQRPTFHTWEYLKPLLETVVKDEQLLDYINSNFSK